MRLFLREERQQVPDLRRAFCFAQAIALSLAASHIAWGQITSPPIRFPSPATKFYAPPTSPTIPSAFPMAPAVTMPNIAPASLPTSPMIAPTVQPSAPSFTAGTPVFAAQPIVPDPAVGTGIPPATLNGTIAPTIPGFDPYADPTLPTTQPYYDPGGTGQFVTDPSLTQQPLMSGATFGQWPRFLQQLRFRYTWLNRGGTRGLGWSQAELSGSFMIPMFFLPENAPLIITPGFNLHLVDGPNTPATGASLPPRLYDAFVDVGWTPQITYGLSADVGIRGGVYSDFSSLTSESFRLQGRGFGVWQTTDTHQWRAGVIYVNRLDIKLLPAGGLVWTPGGPNGNVRFDILFPNPKFAYRVGSYRTNDLWWYLAGEYGGGSWSIKGPGQRFDYNDIRLITGLEWTGQYGLRGFVEGGWVLKREIDYLRNGALGNTDYDPPQTVMLRAGLTY